MWNKISVKGRKWGKKTVLYQSVIAVTSKRIKFAFGFILSRELLKIYLKILKNLNLLIIKNPSHISWFILLL